MAAQQHEDEVTARSTQSSGIITQWICAQSESHRSFRWALATRTQPELCAELMLMLRLALGQQSPFTPLAHGATTVKDDVTDGLHLLTRLLAEFGDPSMGLAFVSQVAGYVAEPVLASELVPRLSFVGLRPSLQGIASLRVMPPLALAGLQPSLQGIAPLRMDPSMWQYAGGAATVPRVMPQLCLIGLRPSLQGCSGLGAPPAEEVTATRRHQAAGSRRLLPRPVHFGSYSAAASSTSAAAAASRVGGSHAPGSQPLLRVCSCSARAVPQLCLAGLRPSLQGCSGLGAPPEEDLSFRKVLRAPTLHVPMAVVQEAAEQTPALCISLALEPSPVRPQAHGTVPPLYLAGLRPSLQGCAGLGAPPSEEMGVNCDATPAQWVVKYAATASTTPGVVPRLYLGGLRASLQGCSGLGAPPSEEVAAQYHTAKSGMYIAPRNSSQTTLSSCPARVSTCHRKTPRRRQNWRRPVPQLPLAGLPVSLQGCAGLGAPPPEAI